VAVSTIGAPSRGPEVAAVTIVHFGSLTGPQSAQVAAALRRLEQRWPGQLRIVWKNLGGYGSSSDLAGEYGAAAQAQGGFWALHDVALRAPSWRYRIETSEILGWMLGAHLDAARAEREVRAGLYRARVEQDKVEARRLGITFAPTVVVNGLVVERARSADYYEKLVERELGEGLLERLGGR
jgi:protein-disulfide isomerase